MLEDAFNDILAKSIRGLDLNANSLGVGPTRLDRCLNGEFDQELILIIAPKLALDTEKLLNLTNYDPKLNPPTGLKVFTSPFGHLGVNSYLIETDKDLLIFDTGTDATALMRYIAKNAPNKAQHIFITHEHKDHVECLSEFSEASIHYPRPKLCESLQYGEISLTTLNVIGHADPAVAYLIEGLESRICIVGDAIFAGSIGGCQTTTSYPVAIKNIRDNLLTLPDDTYLCSGHGGVTTVALEKSNNPYF